MNITDPFLFKQKVPDTWFKYAFNDHIKYKLYPVLANSEWFKWRRMTLSIVEKDVFLCWRALLNLYAHTVAVVGLIFQTTTIQCSNNSHFCEWSCNIQIKTIRMKCIWNYIKTSFKMAILDQKLKKKRVHRKIRRFFLQNKDVNENSHTKCYLNQNY